MNDEVTYPQYRKYLNEKVFFQIISNNEWEEIQIVGSNYLQHRFTVKIMPDRNLLYDMTFNYERNWVKIDAHEYEKIKSNVKLTETK